MIFIIEEIQLKLITFDQGLCQIITHILPLYSSCIDIIFTNQPIMVINSGVHPLLHQNFQHQKISAQIYYPPPYKWLVWAYMRANTDAINFAIKSFNWENAFNGKHIICQVELFNKI